MNPAYCSAVNKLLSRCIVQSTSRLLSTVNSSACSGSSYSSLQSDWSKLSCRFNCRDKVPPIRRCQIGINCSAVPRRTMAGHSKWQNIKHIKAAKDSERSKAIVQIANKIRGVVKETGNADPKFNPSLARLVAEAKSKNIPNSNIEAAIAQAAKAKDSASVVYYEGRGLGGSYFVIEASTDKPTKTKNDLQQLIKKQGGTIGETGTAAHAFDKKGVLEATVPSEDVDMDKFVDVAIEAGAEEVTLETDEVDEKYLRFLCEAQDLFSVKKELEKKELELRSFGVEFIPTATVNPSPKEMESVEKLMERLEDSPEVLRVFINVDAPSS